jgi:hypothetical protein
MGRSQRRDAAGSVSHSDLPRPTILPPVDLRRSEDGHVESIDHYLARLATACGCSPGTLVAIIRQSNTRRDYSEEFIARLEELTGQQGLRCSTFLPLKDAIRTLRMGPTSQRQWCPMCYSCWDHTTSFEPLCWNLAQLSACTIHGTRLEDRCPECGALQASDRSYRWRRQCAACMAPLGHTGPSERVSPQERWADRMMVDLTLICSQDGAQIDPGLFQRRMKSVGQGELSLAAIQRSGRVAGRVGVDSLLRCCSAFGVTPSELLQAPELQMCLKMTFEQEELPEAFLYSRVRNRRNEILSSVLSALLDRRVALIPILVIAKAVGVKGLKARELFPSEYRRYESARATVLDRLPENRVLGRAAEVAVHRWLSVSTSQASLSTFRRIAAGLRRIKSVDARIASALAVEGFAVARAIREAVSTLDPPQVWNRYRPRRRRLRVRNRRGSNSHAEMSNELQLSLF